MSNLRDVKKVAEKETFFDGFAVSGRGFSLQSSLLPTLPTKVAGEPSSLQNTYKRRVFGRQAFLPSKMSVDFFIDLFPVDFPFDAKYAISCSRVEYIRNRNPRLIDFFHDNSYGIADASLDLPNRIAVVLIQKYFYIP